MEDPLEYAGPCGCACEMIREGEVCRYCGIGLASIVVILLIRHRFAKKMSMKEHDLVIGAACTLYRWHYNATV